MGRPAVDECGQCGHGWVFEELTRREQQAGFAGAGDDLNGENGVAAEFKEVIVRADLRDAQDFLPYGGKSDFVRRGGCDEG